MSFRLPEHLVDALAVPERRGDVVRIERLFRVHVDEGHIPPEQRFVVVELEALVLRLRVHVPVVFVHIVGPATGFRGPRKRHLPVEHGEHFFFPGVTRRVHRIALPARRPEQAPVAARKFAPGCRDNDRGEEQKILSHDTKGQTSSEPPLEKLPPRHHYIWGWVVPVRSSEFAVVEDVSYVLSIKMRQRPAHAWVRCKDGKLTFLPAPANWSDQNEPIEAGDEEMMH